MKEIEKQPTELLTPTDELRELILEYPDAPLLVFAGEESTSQCDYYYTSCSDCRASLGEFLDCMQEVNEERIFTDRDEFKEDMENEYGDFDGSDAEFEQFIDDKMAEYEPYWKKVIILYVDN